MGVGSDLTGIPARATDEQWMRQAMALAKQAEKEGEVPVGALIVVEGELVAEGWNCPVASHDPTAHAEIVALRAATRRLGNYRLSNATLYVTLEPCPMCAGALVHARVQRVVFGAFDPLAGSAGSVFDILNSPKLNHRASVTPGILAEECSAGLRAFFKTRR